MVFERYIPELKKYDTISFLHQPLTSGQPLKIVQRHMAHPVVAKGFIVHLSFKMENQRSQLSKADLDKELGLLKGLQ